MISLRFILDMKKFTASDNACDFEFGNAFMAHGLLHVVEGAKGTLLALSMDPLFNYFDQHSLGNQQSQGRLSTNR